MKPKPMYFKKVKSKIRATLYYSRRSLVSKSFILTKCGTKNQSNRDNWVRHSLSQLKNGLKILDAGAGQMRYKESCTHLKYISQDLAEYDGVGDSIGLQKQAIHDWNVDIISDISEIPEEDNSYDAILCTEVFEHIPDPLRVLQEFSRLLKPGGELILTVPVCSLTHQSPYYYYNGFSRNFFEYHLPQCGFNIKVLDYNGNFFEYVAQEFRRIKTTARKYSKLGIIRWIILTVISAPILITLSRLSKKDEGSQEMLSHGIHVLANKI
ncbi:class I SAM-dependent methyltransferase [Candidatus Neomarinimicrobiota bacterium]